LAADKEKRCNVRLLMVKEYGMSKGRFEFIEANFGKSQAIASWPVCPLKLKSLY
jgi:hypothetical protein